MDSARPLPSPFAATVLGSRPRVWRCRKRLFHASHTMASTPNSQSEFLLRRLSQLSGIVDGFAISFMFARLETYARKLI